ncbi:MAG: hypothetical protein KDD48_04330 [Bdellovibrionales bacterium]|nr:hypothetical protein [Bdellovibrionales bacterium]
MKTTHQWVSVVRSLQLYKWVTLIFSAVIAGLVLYLFIQSGQHILVLDRSNHTFYPSQIAKIEDSDVKDFIKRFVEYRYNWQTFDPDQILKTIEPLSTSAFRKGLGKILGKQKAENKEGQSLEQYVAHIHPKLTETQATASFDRILRINSVPLVVPVQVSLHIIQGTRTPWNPFGLYVDSLTEYQQ